MLEIWGRATSSNVQALMWCVGELGLDFIRHDVGHVHGGTDTPEFIAMNPNRTVPVLRDNGGPALWESGAILRYLAGHYAPESFWPGDPVDRADVDRWAEWAKINVAIGFTGPVFWRAVRTPASERDAAAISQSVTALERYLAIAEDRLDTRPYLMGEDLTLADIQLGHVLYRYFDIDIERAEFPALAGYFGRLKKRQAYRDHVMISYEALRA